MKQTSKLATMLILLMAGVINVVAQNPFDVNTSVSDVKVVSGDNGLVFKYGKLHYKILSGNSVEVTGEVRSVCSGRVEIPSVVRYNNKTYTVTRIGKGAFSSQTNLTEIVIPKSVRYINESAFAFSGLTDVIIPGDNVTVNKHAFLSCQNLRVVTLSGRNTSYSDRAFELCHKMTELRIRDTNPANDGKKVPHTSAVIKVIR